MTPPLNSPSTPTVLEQLLLGRDPARQRLAVVPKVGGVAVDAPAHGALAHGLAHQLAHRAISSGVASRSVASSRMTCWRIALWPIMHATLTPSRSSSVAEVVGGAAPAPIHGLQDGPGDRLDADEVADEGALVPGRAGMRLRPQLPVTTARYAVLGEWEGHRVPQQVRVHVGVLVDEPWREVSPSASIVRLAVSSTRPIAAMRPPGRRRRHCIRGQARAVHDARVFDHQVVRHRPLRTPTARRRAAVRYADAGKRMRNDTTVRSMARDT